MGLCVRFVRGLALAGVLLGSLLVGAGTLAVAGATAAVAQTVNSIEVQGNRRVEASTIRSYFHPGPGGRLGPAEIDEALKALYATGLFSDVHINTVGGRIVVTVVENPVINEVAFEGNKKAKLILGAEDFPFPIPLVNTSGGWHFDVDAGRQEILYRRIGRNELDVIQACLAYADAQNEYAAKDHGGGVGIYAQHIVSSPGKKDGLFWRDDADPSPLGELVAEASAEGYKIERGRAPYHGYYFRILKTQGSDAPGGALNYVVKGKMIGGFALIAWPAEYGNSGVMTFMVNHAGIVYQKDLGRRTGSIVKRVFSFNPDQTWKKVDTVVR